MERYLTCGQCNGTGRINTTRSISVGSQSKEVDVVITCRSCHGKGEFDLLRIAQRKLVLYYLAWPVTIALTVVSVLAIFVPQVIPIEWPSILGGVLSPFTVVAWVILLSADTRDSAGTSRQVISDIRRQNMKRYRSFSQIVDVDTDVDPHYFDEEDAMQCHED